MKLSDILLLALFVVMGSMIFAMQKMQKDSVTVEPNIPVPTLKPVPNVFALRQAVSSPELAGSYGRLSVDKFLTEDTIDSQIQTNAPQTHVSTAPSINRAIQPDPAKTDAVAPLRTKPAIALNDFQIETGDLVNLTLSPEFSENRFADRFVDMAEASPLQPDSRGCGTLNHSLKSAPKHAKVRSVAMERKLTNRTSIGVEYVYKDGCYKKAIAPLGALNMPGDDGVNLRLNMRF